MHAIPFKALACPSCLSINQTSPLKALEFFASCGVCGSHFSILDGRIFFMEVPENAPEKKKDEPTDAKGWTAWRRANFEFLKKQLFGENSEKDVLDIGAGPSQFREITVKFSKYYAIDFYPYELVSVVADITKKLPFRDNAFDIVLMSNVLEHIPYPLDLLRECNRILKQNGLIFGTVPFLVKIHQKPYDYNRYTNFMLEKLLSDAGLSAIGVRNLGSSLNLYGASQSTFFRQLFKTRFSENKVVHKVLYLCALLGYKLATMLVKIMHPIYAKAIATPDYTEGYGFKGRKL